MLCACARFARSLKSSLSHSLFCLALALRVCARSARALALMRSLKVFLFLSRFALLLVAPACLPHVHSKTIVSHSLCLALALRLHPLCALARDYTLTRYICPCARSRSSVFAARSLENFSLLIAVPLACSAFALALRARSRVLSRIRSSALRLLCAFALALRVLSLCALAQSFSFSLSLCLDLGRARVFAAHSLYKKVFLTRSALRLLCASTPRCAHSLKTTLSLAIYALALGRARVFSARSLENFSLLIAVPLTCSALALALRARS